MRFNVFCVPIEYLRLLCVCAILIMPCSLNWSDQFVILKYRWWKYPYCRLCWIGSILILYLIVSHNSILSMFGLTHRLIYLPVNLIYPSRTDLFLALWLIPGTRLVLQCSVSWFHCIPEVYSFMYQIDRRWKGHGCYRCVSGTSFGIGSVFIFGGSGLIRFLFVCVRVSTNWIILIYGSLNWRWSLFCYVGPVVT